MATSNDQVVSPVDTIKPEFILSAQSINAEPVELDSTPTSPEKLRARRASRDELLAELGEAEKEVGPFVQSTERLLLVVPCMTDSHWQVNQKRDQLLIERKSNPAVLVDIPQTPGADEIEVAGSISSEKRLSEVTAIPMPTSSRGN
jgi:hypothetical protein